MLPKEWRKSVLVGMRHITKVWEPVVEVRLRREVTVSEQQYCFMLRKSTTDTMFPLRVLME